MTKQMKFGLVMLATAVLSVASLVNARGWVQQGSDWYYQDSSDEFVTETIQASGNSKFYLGEDGRMMRDYFLENYNEATYYFGSNGAMVTNTWVAIDSSLVEEAPEYESDAYWYYFGGNGKAIKGKTTLKPTTIDGRKYIFNANGQMCTGWVNADTGTVNPDENENPFQDALYYCGGDNDGVVRTGWVSYYEGYETSDDDWRADLDTIYFYFNPQNGKKTYSTEGENTAKTKNINGRTYAFNEEGIMYTGWNAYDSGNENNKWAKPVYFSGNDDGHLVKKGWVYAVPSKYVDSSANDEDEDKYMYFANNGTIYKDVIKKVNGKYYAFSATGVMKTGLVIWCPEGDTNGVHYVDTVDLDEAVGSDIMKKGDITTGDSTDDVLLIDWAGVVSAAAGTKYENFDGLGVKLHYFGSDGARRVGANVIEFSDNNYTFVSKNSGNYDSGSLKKKYYSMGFLCTADPDIKYGLFVEGTATTLAEQYGDFNTLVQASTLQDSAATSGYVVLTTSGGKQKGADSTKKDADGNYWLINKYNGFLQGIFTVPVARGSKTITFKSEFLNYYAAIAGTVARSSKVGATITTDQLKALNVKGGSTFEATELVTGDTQFDDSANNFVITAHEFSSVNRAKKGDGNVYLKVTGTGYWFQSDYNGNSNKWLPCGVKDQAGRTAHVWDHAPIDTTSGGTANQSYSLYPTDEYFLNCYLKD
jgi:glucan-binding YG repeat protein